MNNDSPRPAWHRPPVTVSPALPDPSKAKRPEAMPPPILIPVSPGRRGVYEPVYPRPACAPPQVRYPDPPRPASAADSRLARRMAAPRPRSKPSQDTPTERIPRMTLEERRKRLLEILLDVEADLEMLDDPVPF